MKRPILIGFVGLIGVFLLIQLIPYGRQHTNPPVVKEPNWDSPETRDLAVRACFDCHSNEVVWPWYSHVAPISWLVQRDVEEGREHLNLSDWEYNKKSAEIVGTIKEGEMPLPIYLITHPEARLTAAEKAALITGFTETIANSR
jgi:hypothetical protein